MIGLITEWFDEKVNYNYVVTPGDLGGTMRLGAQKPSLWKTANCAKSAWQSQDYWAPSSPLYEMNGRYIEQLENAGMKISGYSAKQHLVESVEIANHPWYVAVQFHPEFTSQPRGGHPLFNSFVAAAKQTKNSIYDAQQNHLLQVVFVLAIVSSQLCYSDNQ